MNISLNSVKVIAIIVYVGLVSSISSLFLIFLFAHEKEPFIYNVWSYIESEIFRAIIVSFAIPIILFVLENRFNIIQNFLNIKSEKDERELREYNDRRKQAEEERRGKQLDAISKTIEMFKEVNLIVSKTRFYEPNKDTTINSILIDLTSISIILSDVINTWVLRFPIFPSTIPTLFADYVRLLYWSAWAVAHFIQNKLYKSKIELREVQEHLAMIQRGVVGIAFHPIFNSMKYCMNLLELINELSDILDGMGPFKSKSSYFRIRNTILECIQKEIKKYIDKQYNENLKNNLYKITNDEKINIPINIIWNECNNKLNKDFYKYDIEIYESLKKAISKLAMKSISKKDNISANINEDSILEEEKITIPEEIKITINYNIQEIVRNLVELKMYQTLLNINDFTKEEIFSSTDMVKETQESIELRTKVQKLYQDVYKYPKIIDYQSYFNSSEFKSLENSFFNIRNLELMNMIAVDTIKRMKEIGKKMRFSSIIEVDESNLGSVQ